MTKSQAIIATMRLPFVLLAVVSVVLGGATAHYTNGTLHTASLLLALLGAVCAHISVNTFNEYADFKSGLDQLTTRTLFSGGSGALPAQPQAASAVLASAVTTLLITITVGIYFLLQHGMALLPIGLLGVILIVGYTPYINRHPMLCLLAPGIGLGPLTVLGSYFVISGNYALTAVMASLIPFFLASNLLLLNQFPDTNADRTVGRRTLPIVYGYRFASNIYALFLLLTAASLFLSVTLELLPPLALFALTALTPALSIYRQARHYNGDPVSLLPALKRNVVVTLLTPLFVSIVLFTA